MNNYNTDTIQAHFLMPHPASFKCIWTPFIHQSSSVNPMVMFRPLNGSLGVLRQVKNRLVFPPNNNAQKNKDALNVKRTSIRTTPEATNYCQYILEDIHNSVFLSFGQ